MTLNSVMFNVNCLRMFDNIYFFIINDHVSELYFGRMLRYVEKPGAVFFERFLEK